MKKVLFLFTIGAGVLTFSKVSSAKEIGATGGLKSALQAYCPEPGESCIKLETVVLDQIAPMR